MPSCIGSMVVTMSWGSMYCGSSPVGVIHSGRAGCISALMIGAGLGDVILKVSCMSDHRVK